MPLSSTASTSTMRLNSLSRLARSVVVVYSKQQQQLSRRGLLCRTFASLPEMEAPSNENNDGAAAAAATTPPTTTMPSERRTDAAAPSYLHRTVFRRPLNPPAIAFSSPEGRALFSQSLADGTAEGFFPLIEQFSTQDEPAFCGLASLSMVLNALCVDPRRAWKGPWRFYSERLLDCCVPLERVKEEGVSLPQVACLARCNGAVARVVRPPPLLRGAAQAQEREDARGETLTLEAEIEGIDREDAAADEAAQAALADAERAFRDAVVASCRGGPESIVASYSRRLVAQTGDGHFSPIGAYNAERDAVLVLDVARFKYSPHWMPLRSLVRAMRPLDKATGLPRGWLAVKAAAAPRSVLFTLEPSASSSESSAAVVRLFVEKTLPALLLSASSEKGKDNDGASPSSSSSNGASVVAKAAAAAPLAAVAAFVGLRAQSAAAARATVAAAAAAAAAEHQQHQQHRHVADGSACGGAEEGGGADEAGKGPPSPSPSSPSSECAIPDAAAALLAELERWPAVDAVRAALDAAHPCAAAAAAAAAAAPSTSPSTSTPTSASSAPSGGGGGCAARSSAAASVSGRSDVASAAAAAAREQRELESSGLLPERVALLLAVAAAAAAGGGGGGGTNAAAAAAASPWPAAAKQLLTPPAGSVLAAEVAYLRAQWKELPALDAASAASAAAAAGKGCGCGSV